MKKKKINAKQLQSAIYLYYYLWTTVDKKLIYGFIMEPEEGMTPEGELAACIVQQMIAEEMGLT